jgi:hypothetical protein
MIALTIMAPATNDKPRSVGSDDCVFPTAHPDNAMIESKNINDFMMFFPFIRDMPF